MGTDIHGNHHQRRHGSGLLVDWPSVPSPDEEEESQGASPANDDADAVSSDDGGGKHGHTLPCPGYRRQLTEVTEPSSATESESDSTTSKQRRSIHFAHTLHIRIIPSLEDYSTERVDTIWYTKADLADQRKEYVATVKEMRRRRRREECPSQTFEIPVRTSDGVSIIPATARGLEHLTSKTGFKRQQEEQLRTINAVLLAQDNDFTTEEIAVIYAHRARRSKSRAQSLGRIDAEEAAIMRLQKM